MAKAKKVRWKSLPTSRNYYFAFILRLPYLLLLTIKYYKFASNFERAASGYLWLRSRDYQNFWVDVIKSESWTM